MSKKFILIVTHGFYPEQSPRAFRATELAKEFCRQGYQVTVMAPERDGSKELLNELSIEYITLGKLKWKIHSLNGKGRFKGLYNKIVSRLFPLLLAYPEIELVQKVASKLEGSKKRYDLLISIAVPYPIHWGVAKAWSKDKSKNVANTWIADCGDPYCLQENDTFQPPFYFRWIEKWFMRKADYISVPTQNSYKGYFEEFHPKLRVISQGFRFEDVEIKPTMNDGVIRFGYGGAFIKDRRDPTEFLTYLCLLDKSIKFEFYVYTNQKDFILPFVSDSRIKLKDPIPRLEMLSLFSSFNFVVNFNNKGLAQTPSKLIDYAIIDKPILQIKTGALDLDLVGSFMSGDYSKAFAVSEPNQFRIEKVAQKFLSLLDVEDVK